MKLAISGETLSSTDSLKEILEIIIRYEIDNLELWALNCEATYSGVHPMTYRNRDIAKAKRLLKEYDINVACVAFGGALDSELTKNAELYAEELSLAVEVASELNAGIVNHYCDYICRKPQVDIALLEKYYGKALKRAEELDVIMALENEAHDITQTPDNMLKIIQTFDSKHFKTNFDATNYYQSGNEAFPDAYEILKDDIAYVHIKNGCIFNSDFGHLVECKGGTMTRSNTGKHIYYPTVDKGAVNISGLLERLKNDGYSGYCTLEPHTSRDIALKYYLEETKYLKNLGYF